MISVELVNMAGKVTGMQTKTNEEKTVHLGARVKRGLRLRIKQDALDLGMTSEQVVDRILRRHFAMDDSERRHAYEVLQ